MKEPENQEPPLLFPAGNDPAETASLQTRSITASESASSGAKAVPIATSLASFTNAPDPARQSATAPLIEPGICRDNLLGTP